MSAASLTLDQVRKVFKPDLLKPAQVALEGLTVTFAAGACTGLLGANGAGKTTTLRVILGLIRPDQGSVSLGGKPLDVEAKRRIGYMPEVNKLPLQMTPAEMLEHQLKIYDPPEFKGKDARQGRVEEVLDEIGLASHRKKRIAHLSKGMGRRLAWGLATIHRPALLILDEPSSGLDPLGRRQMLAWIEREKKRGATILLCTHELNQVSTLCDELHILRKGRLVLSSGKGKRQGAKDVAWRHRYNLQVSGVDQAQLEAMAQGGKLPRWLDLKIDGFVAELGFADYKDAAPWLQAMVAKGLVVLRFGDESFLGEDDILPYFEGE